MVVLYKKKFIYLFKREIFFKEEIYGRHIYEDLNGFRLNFQKRIVLYALLLNYLLRGYSVKRHTIPELIQTGYKTANYFINAVGS